MSEYDVMTLAGHSSFATTHKFYLAVADDLIHRARVATAQGLRQKLVQIGADASFGPQQKKASSRNCLPQNNLTNGQEWIWTTDTRIFSPLLYQLSYLPSPETAR